MGVYGQDFGIAKADTVLLSMGRYMIDGRLLLVAQPATVYDVHCYRHFGECSLESGVSTRCGCSQSTWILTSALPTIHRYS